MNLYSPDIVKKATIYTDIMEILDYDMPEKEFAVVNTLPQPPDSYRIYKIL